LNASKVIVFTINLNCGLHAVSVGKPSGRQIFGKFGFLTRSSAVAERPHDASCHWIFC